MLWQTQHHVFRVTVPSSQLGSVYKEASIRWTGEHSVCPAPPPCSMAWCWFRLLFSFSFFGCFCCRFFSLSLSLVFVCLLLLLFDGFVVIVALCFFGGAAVFSGVGQDHCPTEIISVGAKICMSTKRPFVYFYALFFLPRTACMPIKM